MRISAHRISPDRTALLLFGGCLIGLLFLVYAPAIIGKVEFVSDDGYYILQNTKLLALNTQNLAAIWTTPTRYEYFPVTITSFALDFTLWGLDPKMFRTTNLILFTLIGVVSFRMALSGELFRLSSDAVFPKPAVFLAVLLVLFHPVNADSALLVSNRKELLYVLFGLLSLHYYVRTPISVRARIASLLLMVTAQLAKGTGVVLPALFLCYELTREGSRDDKLRALKQLVPFFAVAAVIFLYQFSVAVNSGVVSTGSGIVLANRAGGVIMTLHKAVSHLVLPHDLTYEYDMKWTEVSALSSEWFVLLLLVLVTGYLGGTRKNELLFLWCLIFVPLLPYMNIVPLRHGTPGQMVYYDHYLLFSCVVSAFLLTRSLIMIPGRWRYVSTAVMIIILMLYIAQDRALAKTWKNRESLYRENIVHAPEMARSYLFLGNAYIEEGRYAEAVQWLQKGYATPQGASDPAFLQGLGDAYGFSGQYQRAAGYYTKHLEHDPENRKSLQNLSSSLIMLKNYKEARKIIHRLLLLAPNDPEAMANLAIIDAAKE